MKVLKICPIFTAENDKMRAIGLVFGLLTAIRKIWGRNRFELVVRRLYADFACRFFKKLGNTFRVHLT